MDSLQKTEEAISELANLISYQIKTAVWRMEKNETSPVQYNIRTDMEDIRGNVEALSHLISAMESLKRFTFLFK